MRDPGARDLHGLDGPHVDCRPLAREEGGPSILHPDRTVLPDRVLLAIGVISLLRERAAATAQHTAYAAGILVLVLISSATFAILGLVSAINAGSGTWSQWNDHVSMALFFVSWSLGAGCCGSPH